jgi:hypothetical protein
MMIKVNVIEFKKCFRGPFVINIDVKLQVK